MIKAILFWVAEKLVAYAIKKSPDIIDYAIDKLELKYYKEEDTTAKAMMLLCNALREILKVPDDDEDQSNPS